MKTGSPLIQISGNEIKKNSKVRRVKCPPFYQQEINVGVNSMRGRHMRNIMFCGSAIFYYMPDILHFTKSGLSCAGWDPSVPGACGSQGDPPDRRGGAHKKTAPGEEAVFYHTRV